ncbi:MAG TPA: hypothetical protein VHM64_01680, partial [Candidatus Binatia bacterium]|nr:hypothetical protein [Candidatus Binatia bacterium]
MTSLLETFATGQSSGNGSNGQASRTQENEGPRESKERSAQLALLGTSAAVFAHELGNPLQAIF